ncbi:hypothetical protein SERLADRAFT_432955 [Serpula lacrymans var. lacrymans S7.9]|uniref:Uncharacterized protein n=1 Tax=Serpula lacrymans var. lacrymans (strain S7.9) TaxID=578457 RepID=F8NI52_SERL9|nr:uncharacterized protein SERLADRAFT_432955 [Serpula lacrymans var. lacrymans S7.9]EGO28949.1 hypothetical protein SERLADRAFT_432955 [Serpula lacrymans var. lacrymans S7.9]
MEVTTTKDDLPMEEIEAFFASQEALRQVVKPKVSPRKLTKQSGRKNVLHRPSGKTSSKESTDLNYVANHGIIEDSTVDKGRGEVYEKACIGQGLNLGLQLSWSGALPTKLPRRTWKAY